MGVVRVWSMPRLGLEIGACLLRYHMLRSVCPKIDGAQLGRLVFISYPITPGLLDPGSHP